MSLGAIYNELKGWQTGISSIFGFGALIVAALWNFNLNRRRDTELRGEEALSVATALYGEILLLRKEVASIAKTVASMEMSHRRKVDKQFLEAHPLSDALLYKALAPKIGLLNPDLIIGITEFHQAFQEVKNSLPLLLDKPDRQYSYSSLTVLILARNAVRNIQPTLSKIEGLALISKSAENIDLGDVDDVIEIEQEAFGQ